jgi:hypothetical protein
MNLNINDRISWTCSAGVLEGIISNICLRHNGAKQIVPWIDIDVTVTQKKDRAYSVRLCATESNLKMMRVAKLETELA